MRSVWGAYIPVRAEEFPGPATLRKQLRRCSCGQMTFLSLPCRNCGAQNSEPAFRWALRKAWTRRIGRWIFASAYLLLAGYAALQIWVPLAALIAAGTVGALAVDLIRSTSEEDICFWLFHDSARKKKELADAAKVEALTNAYDMDLQRLEQMIELEPGPECAERVFYMAQDMAQVFHNRQVSALIANCLAALPLSEGICVDLDQVCAWLEPEDVSPKVLSKLGECARFTCLPAGEPTARFVGRFCAFRVQEMIENNFSMRSYLVRTIPDLFVLDEFSLQSALQSEQEQACLSALWNLAAVYLTPQMLYVPESPVYPENLTVEESLNGTTYIADTWLWDAWRDPTSAAFLEMERLFNDRLGWSLKKQWGKEQDNYDDDAEP